MAAEIASTPPTLPAGVPGDAHLAYSFCAYVDGMPDALPAGWTEVWAPTSGSRRHLKGNYAVLLLAADPQASPQLTLAIQGTQDLEDVLQDFHVVPQLPFAPIRDAQIAHGSHHGLHELLELEGTYQGSTQSLDSLLKSLPAGSSLLVTGHSLGGNLASVLAPWIAANVAAFGPNQQPLERLPANLTAITFAAPTAGNAAFAQFLDANPDRYAAHFNRNDVVSNVWAQSGPLQIDNIYGLFPAPGPSPAPALIGDVLSRKINQMASAVPPVSYTQTKGTIFDFLPAVPDPPPIDPPPSDPPPIDPSPLDPWLWELGYQHNYAYCRHFLGPHGGCKP